MLASLQVRARSGFSAIRTLNTRAYVRYTRGITGNYRLRTPREKLSATLAGILINTRRPRPRQRDLMGHHVLAHEPRTPEVSAVLRGNLLHTLRTYALLEKGNI